MIYFAIATGCLLIVVLGLYIYRTLSAQKERQQAQKEILDKHLKEHQEQQEYVTSSINIIIKALETSQIEVVEASIRLKVLVDQLRPNLEQADFPVMESVFEATKDIPKLKAWKALTKQERKNFTKKINTLEVKHAEDVKAEVKQLGELMAKRA
jgi:hypothetical protein